MTPWAEKFPAEEFRDGIPTPLPPSGMDPALEAVS